MFDMKKTLITCGFPRSGNTFLNQMLNLTFFPELDVNLRHHSVKFLTNQEKVIVPLRNPADAMTSWHLFRSPKDVNLDLHIKFYLRFHKAVLQKKSDVVILNFDSFTKDNDYVKIQIFDKFNAKAKQNVTCEQVKEIMLEKGYLKNLPQDNQMETKIVKEKLSNLSGFDQCVELYNNLKALG
jgi:hypothetical protein